MNQVSFDYPHKLNPSFVNLQTNQYDTIIWEGGRGGAKSEAEVSAPSFDSTHVAALEKSADELERIVS